MDSGSDGTLGDDSDPMSVEDSDDRLRTPGSPETRREVLMTALRAHAKNAKALVAAVAQMVERVEQSESESSKQIGRTSRRALKILEILANREELSEEALLAIAKQAEVISRRCMEEEQTAREVRHGTVRTAIFAASAVAVAGIALVSESVRTTLARLPKAVAAEAKRQLTQK